MGDCGRLGVGSLLVACDAIGDRDLGEAKLAGSRLESDAEPA